MFKLNEKAAGLTPYAPNTAALPVRLDANESFLPLPDALREKILREALALPMNRYPDPEARALREAFASRYGVPAENVCAGNGSDELISVLLQTFLQKGDALATVSPDFSMYAFYGYLAECRHVEIEAGADWEISVDKVIETCNKENVRLLIFSNPCNPTGRGVPREEILRLVRSVSALVVVDEAYMDFWDQSVLNVCTEYDNLLVLRTCSKALGLAALRVGFAVGNGTLIGALQAARSPYNVNALSQCAAAAVLRETEFCDGAARALIAAKGALEAGLRRIAEETGGFSPVPSCTNFVTLRLPDAAALNEALRAAGVSVRHFGGLSALRITAGTEEENAAVLSAVRDYFAKEKKGGAS